jgi:glyoxylate reductase
MRQNRSVPGPLVVVTRPVAREAIDLLRTRCEVRVLDGADDRPLPTPDELIPAVRDAEIVYTLPANPLTRAVIDAAPKLRLIATMGTGYDNVDVAAARARKIPVTYAPNILNDTTADGAFALLLSTARRLPEAERFLRAGKFRGWTPFLFLGHDVFEKTLGIVGMGRIGRAVGRRATGFRMSIVYSDARRNEEAERELGARYVSFEELLAEADFVSLHVPLLPETRHLIDERALRKMKRTAVLINTSRGPVVDEAALARALRERVIAAAGLDVYEREPEVHPDLLSLENVVLLPHIVSASPETRRRMALRAVENVFAFLDGRPLLDPVP